MAARSGYGNAVCRARGCAARCADTFAFELLVLALCWKRPDPATSVVGRKPSFEAGATERPLGEAGRPGILGSEYPSGRKAGGLDVDKDHPLAGAEVDHRVRSDLGDTCPPQSRLACALGAAQKAKLRWRE